MRSSVHASSHQSCSIQFCCGPDDLGLANDHGVAQLQLKNPEQVLQHLAYENVHALVAAQDGVEAAKGGPVTIEVTPRSNTFHLATLAYDLGTGEAIWEMEGSLEVCQPLVFSLV